MNDDLNGKQKGTNSQSGPAGPNSGKNGRSESSTGATGPSAPGGSGNGPANPGTKVIEPMAVGMKPRLLRRLIISRQFTEKIPDARLVFKQLDIKGKNPEPGNLLFQASGPGNIIDIIDRPYERFFGYETLLEDLCADDEDKYKIIHKGTPFYFLAWTAFFMGDYEKAVFYMDAAISEDKKNLGGKWTEYPAGRFLTLSESRDQAAWIITQELRAEVDTQIERFKKVTNKALTLEKYVNEFVIPLMEDREARSIITALYSYVLEYSDRLILIRLRSDYGGSIEPFLVHLFKGGLIFESLIKKIDTEILTNKDKAEGKLTIGSFLYDREFRKKYGVEDITEHLEKRFKTLDEIIDYFEDGKNATIAFSAVCAIRNFTGHTLARTGEFKDPEDYTQLYHQVINALFYVIAKKINL
jgi:hypothetical protein